MVDTDSLAEALELIREGCYWPAAPRFIEDDDGVTLVLSQVAALAMVELLLYAARNPQVVGEAVTFFASQILLSMSDEPELCLQDLAQQAGESLGL
jgi:hypothetical protein